MSIDDQVTAATAENKSALWPVSCQCYLNLVFAISLPLLHGWRIYDKFEINLGGAKDCE